MNQLAASPTEAPSSTPSDANPMRKIIIMVGVAIVVFLAVTGYSVHKSVQSIGQLAAIKDMYYPVLQKTEANIVRLDKMEELFMRAVMLGDHDPLDEAQDFFGQADKVFAELTVIYPDHSADVVKLRGEFKRYNDLAMKTAEALLKHSGNIREQTQQMNKALADLRLSIKQFRDASYDNFVKTLSQSQQTVKVNLYMGIALGMMNLCLMGVLVFFIKNNVNMMAVIAEQNATLEKRVAERTSQLRQKTNDIQSMLQNMPQGVLTVLPGGVIHPEYSAYMETIFETKDIAGKGLMDLVFSQTSLGANDLSQVDAAAASCIGEDVMNFEFNSHLLVTEFDKTMPNGSVKSLELSWSPIADNDVVEKLMLCVRDVTAFKLLANEAGAQKRELEIIGEILAVSQEKFQDFVEGAYAFIKENDEIIRKTADKDLDAVGLLFRNMHTIKGNGRTYGLQHMINVVHETEQEYDDLRQDPDKVWDPTSLLAQLDQVRTLVDEYHKINDVTLGRKGPGRRGSVERFFMVDKEQVARTQALIDQVNADDLAAMREVLADVGQTLRLIGTEKVEHVLAGIIESMPSLAKELGKEPPQITIDTQGLVVRNHIVGLLKNVFTHVFRNSVDHGIETAEVRQSAGKAPVGQIRLTMGLDNGRLQFKLRDDGKGLAIGRIRQKAIDSGLLTEADAPTPEAVAQLIFASGFSTADKVTEVSGRGVGMDAVKGFLRNEGGDVAIAFTDGNTTSDQRSFELVISLPDKYAVQAGA
ncbi:MAG: ATP-binding protein [Aquabacterium sp.]|nr:ATP-binding protein [Aquabacterium sp.]